MEREPESELMDQADQAGAYASADSDHLTQYFLGRLFELVTTRESLNVIDLGTGPASIPIAIALERPNWRIAAVDGSEAMLAIARQRIDEAHLADRVTTHLADVKATGLPAHSFDLILSSSVLHHIPQPAAFWEEVKRLARPGTMLFLRDLRRPATVHEVNQLVFEHSGGDAEVLQREFHNSLRSAFSIDEVKAQIAEAGMHLLVVEEVPDRFFDVYGPLS